MRYILALTAAILIAQSALARVTPLPERVKPHSLWQYRTLPTWNGRSLDDYTNQRVNSDQSGNIQNEQQAAINPVNPDNMVAVWRDFRLGYRRVGVGYSMDGGETWTDNLFPQMYYPWQSDPILTVDENGVFTANMISYEENYGDNGLLQVSSYDGGVTWQDSVWASLVTDGSAFEDKQMFCVDTAAASPYHGTFYCAWSHFYMSDGNFDSTHIYLVYKRPGEDYSAPVQISSRRSVQWANVTTGPNGEVYVSWVSYWDGGIKFAKSLDGGVTFTEEELVRETAFASADIAPSLLIFSYGVMAVDMSAGPHHGRLYMVFTDAVSAFEETDVFIMYSDNEGDTWSTPVVMNDDNVPFSCDQFHPWISVDEVGRVWVVFYDRRNDPNNLLMDLYFTVSTDGGATWRPNERITEVSSNPAEGSLDAGLIGEYVGWSARDGNALAVWTDTRLGNQDAFAAIIDSIFVESSANEPNTYQPSTFSLSAYPNPFNPTTQITFSVADFGNYTVAIHDITGRRVKEFSFHAAASEQTFSFDAHGLPSGVYFARLEDAAGRGVATAKLLLLK